MEEINAKIRAFLAKYFQNVEIQDDQDIFSMGFVNSLFAMQLVLFVEKEFGISVDNEDLDIDNFRTLNTMTSLITRKQAARL